MTRSKPAAGPLAMARVLAMYLAVQPKDDTSGMRLLESLDAFKRIGIAKADFRRVADALRSEGCCEFSRHDWLHNDDLELVDGLLDAIDDPRERLQLCRLAGSLVAADGRVDEFERQLYDHMLLHWGYTRSSVTQAILAEHLG